MKRKTGHICIILSVYIVYNIFHFFSLLMYSIELVLQNKILDNHLWYGKKIIHTTPCVFQVYLPIVREQTPEHDSESENFLSPSYSNVAVECDWKGKIFPISKKLGLFWKTWDFLKKIKVSTEC